MNSALDSTMLPVPVFDDQPEFVELYWVAWQLAWDHVRTKPNVPQSPYMDEGFSDSAIWIWDTCFMAHYCKYAPALFPGIQSLDNFYLPMHDGVRSALKIHHPDNPPLFAWTELEYYRFTGDNHRLTRILADRNYLQKHFLFIDQARPGSEFPFANRPVTAQRDPHGYRWTGCPSGMDNTPRGLDKHDAIYWVDLAAQQALAANSIATLAESCGDAATASEYRSRFTQLQQLLNQFYYDEQDGMYYDIDRQTLQPCKVLTPASFWPMLAKVCTAAQAQRMVRTLTDPNALGGALPWPSVARNDPAYQTNGNYFRGSVWLPLTYMTCRGLQNYGFHAIAHSAARQLIEVMYATWRDVEPHSIWECYKPEAAEPATAKNNTTIVRADYCGWSALGPIALLIEAVIGIHAVDAVARTIQWQTNCTTRHGVQNLRFGSIVTSLLIDHGRATVQSNAAYELQINGHSYAIRPGDQQFALTSP